MAGATAPTPRSRDLARTIRHWKGRAYLAWARLLQHTVAGDARRQGHVARRNRAIRSAIGHGVDKPTIARALRLSEGTVGQAAKGQTTSE